MVTMGLYCQQGLLDCLEVHLIFLFTKMISITKFWGTTRDTILFHAHQYRMRLGFMQYLLILRVKVSSFLCF